jgi:type II secretory pathway predicted ATPase ExeA
MIPYFRHFGLERDPFLDTADPHFYRTTPALGRARTRLVAGVLESRGLQVVVGDPGTGKTSLMAQVERELLGRDEVRLAKILDPSFASETEFLLGVARAFGLALPPRSPAALKNALKNYLYDAAVLDGLTLALLIDEAQNASDEIFEVLRLLLNYDVPQRKLLNVVLFGQSELRARLEGRRNLADRVDGWIVLDPLDVSESRAMLAYRLTRAGAADLAALLDADAAARARGLGRGRDRGAVDGAAEPSRWRFPWLSLRAR